ncbi:tetratricopeptide repeat protein [Bradyrhizobium sp. HKCCYLRH3061]|uniref:tetratricopeptide repeat protein n=1 Tax=Bradyrhizobium sp. HKCCYLRH3061 TaxID=3420734 RepID=UPI003EBCE0F2
MTSLIRSAIPLILIAGLLGTPSLAEDMLGTAGPIRSFGFGTCKLPYPARARGECDPPEVSATLPADVRSQQRVVRARQLTEIARLPQAIAELDTAITEQPGNVPALLLRARLRIPAQLTEATRDVKAALQAAPENADALATMAFILIGQDDQAALQLATDALVRNPPSVDALWIRAILANRSGRPEQSEADLDRAIAIEPDDRRSRMTRAEIRLQTGKAAGAKEDLDAILAAGSDLQALQMRATILAGLGDDSAALADLNKVLGPPGQRVLPGPARPDLVNMFVQRALILTRTGREPDARQDLETIVALGGNRAILQMQVYLRGHGFPDLALNGKRSDQLDDALRACFINSACGRGIAIRG